MSFKLRHDASQWFKHLRSHPQFNKDWDIYYLCLMMGFAANRRGPVTPANSTEFIKYIIEPYSQQKGVLISMLACAVIHKNGISIRDRDSVRREFEELINADNGDKLSEAGVRCLNEYAAGGYEYMAEVYGDPPHSPEAFLGHYVNHITKAAKQNPAWNYPVDSNFTEEYDKKVDLIHRQDVAQINALLNKPESETFEIKGSLRLNVDRLLNGDGKLEVVDRVAIVGALKAIVAFLNSDGGTLVIGVLEKSKFPKISAGHMSEFELFKDYIIVGINPEMDTMKSGWDEYHLKLRELIATHIDGSIADLIKVRKLQFKDRTLCEVSIISPSGTGEWYYLDKNQFYVRDGNRTMELKGADQDKYKKRKKRPKNIPSRKSK